MHFNVTDKQSAGVHSAVSCSICVNSEATWQYMKHRMLGFFPLSDGMHFSCLTVHYWWPLARDGLLCSSDYFDLLPTQCSVLVFLSLESLFVKFFSTEGCCSWHKSVFSNNCFDYAIFFFSSSFTLWVVILVYIPYRRNESWKPLPGVCTFHVYLIHFCHLNTHF